MDNPMNDSSEHSDSDIPAVFVGQDKSLFCNYHPSLTGEQNTDIGFTYQGLIVFTMFSTALRPQQQFFAKWNPTRTMPGETQG